MKKFFATYKWLLLFWLIFIAIVFWLVPLQINYYLENDVRQFRSQRLMPALVWIGAILALTLLAFLLRQRLPFKQLLLSFFYGVFLLASFLFIFQDTWLAGALWLNRQYKKASIQKAYLVANVKGEGERSIGVVFYDLSVKQIVMEKMLRNKFTLPEVKPGDTVRLDLHKGLLGIDFCDRPYPEE